MPPRLPSIDPMMVRINLREEKMMSVSSTNEVSGETAGPASGLASGPASGLASVLVREPGEGPGTWALGSLFEQLASGEETGGGFALSLVTQPPGAATPVHIHTLEDEAFYLLDGTMTYSADGELHRLAPGAFIFFRRGAAPPLPGGGGPPPRVLHLLAAGTAARVPGDGRRPRAVPGDRFAGGPDGAL